MPKKWFLRIVSVYTLGLVFVTVILNKLFFKNYFPHPLALDLQFFLLVLVCSIVLISFVYFLVTRENFFIPRIIEKLEVLQELLFALNHREKIYISFLAGFSEEFFFRGLLQPLWGITIASVIFGALHFVTFGYFLLATAIGYYLGAVFHYSGNIFIPMMVHSIYNVFAFNLLAGIYSSDREDTPNNSLKKDN